MKENELINPNTFFGKNYFTLEFKENPIESVIECNTLEQIYFNPKYLTKETHYYYAIIHFENVFGIFSKKKFFENKKENNKNQEKKYNETDFENDFKIRKDFKQTLSLLKKHFLIIILFENNLQCKKILDFLLEYNFQIDAAYLIKKNSNKNKELLFVDYNNIFCDFKTKRIKKVILINNLDLNFNKKQINILDKKIDFSNKIVNLINKIPKIFIPNEALSIVFVSNFFENNENNIIAKICFNILQDNSKNLYNFSLKSLYENYLKYKKLKKIEKEFFNDVEDIKNRKYYYQKNKYVNEPLSYDKLYEIKNKIFYYLKEINDQKENENKKKNYLVILEILLKGILEF